MIAAVAANGCAAVMIGDVVSRAKVSRAAFYAHFDGKQECFLAATRADGQLMVDHVIAATRTAPVDSEPEQVLRAAVRALLAFLAAQPEFTRVFYVEMAAVGATAELIRSAVHRGDVASLPRLEQPLVQMHLTLLGGSLADGHGHRDDAAPPLQPPGRRPARDLPPDLPPVRRGSGRCA